ncbi:hypothetical protein MKY20_11520 [Cytobacillus sp. FSL W8-0315]|uniref:hypothetical protein n=1 Tax=Cytobacillus sp. FSL W8-0315 TaxID=2921600 RepID=UPI0030F5897A
MAKQVTEKEMQNVTENTADALKKQDKVKVRLHMPQDQLNKLRAAEEAGKKVEWPYQTVAVNGYIFQIQLGKSVEVPQTVAEILEQAGLI